MFTDAPRGKKVWESAEDLKNFQSSPLCTQLLQELGIDSGDSPSTSHFLSLQWDRGFSFGEDLRRDDDLHGRVTLTKLTVPYPADIVVPDHETWKIWRRALFDAFRYFLPKGCEDLRGPPPFRWMAFSWVDVENGQSEQPGREAVACVLFRWNGPKAGPEREEAVARDPEVKESWAKAVANVVPPVASWEQERWDIVVPPLYNYSDEED